MNLASRFGAVFRHMALAAGVGVAVLAVALAGLGFLVTGVFLNALSRYGAAPAAAMTGGGLLVLAVLMGVVGRSILRRVKRKQPGFFSDFGGVLGLGIRLAGFAVRKDPKKAIILAAIGGALVEYVMSENRRDG